MLVTIFRSIRVLFLGILISGSCLAEVHWPGLMGPDRNGWAANFMAPEKWPEKLQRKWQVEVGTGYATPIVSKGFVYQHGREGDSEVVRCIELNSGDVRWKKSYVVPFKMGGGGERHGKGPKSCPVLADGRLFTMSITGVLSAWDIESGERLWYRDYSAKFKKGHPYWGTATSPIVDQDRVFVHFGTDDEGRLVALDTKTGNEIWADGKEGASYSSPHVVKLHGVLQLVEWNHESLVGLDVKSGKRLWQYSFPHVSNNQNMPTPTIHNGKILLGGENRGIVGLEPKLADGKWSVNELWHQSKVALDMSSAIMNDGLLYGFSHYGRGRLFCLDPATGKILWQGPGRTGNNVAFLAIPGYVLALINDGELRIIKATGESYQAVRSYNLSDTPTWAPPVLLENSLLIKDHDTLTHWSFN